MKKWIRWKGILPFAAIIILAVLFWTLLVDMIVERTMEAMGTKMVGAKVEIDKTDVSLLPTGLRIDRLQVTNPDAPMTNAVEVAGMHLTLDSVGLLKRKVIVNEMEMDGLRFNTPREKSGEIKKAGAKKADGEKSEALQKILDKAGCGRIELPGLSTPDLKNILEQENLKSLKMAETLRTELSAERSRLDQMLSELPDENKFNEYKTRIEKLQGKKASLESLLTTAGDATAIQKEIQTDIDRIKKAIGDYEKKLKRYQSSLSQLKKAPLEDIQRLKAKYALSSQGLANMSRLLLGPQFCTWWQKGYGWYQRAKPYLKLPAKSKAAAPETVKPLRGKGLDVKFREKAPLPDFLLRFARANVVIDAGDITGVLENITVEPALVGQPATFKFLGREMKTLQSFSALGEINYIRPDHPKNKLDLMIKALELNNVVLSGSGPMPVALNSATADVDLDFSLDGKNLNSRFNAGLNAVDMAAGATETSGVMFQVLNEALASVRNFNIQATAKGTVEDFDIKITSDLDKTLKSAVGDMVRKEAEKFGAQLEKAVMAQVSGPLSQAQSSLNALGPVGEELTQRLDMGRNLLKSELFKGMKLPF